MPGPDTRPVLARKIAVHAGFGLDCTEVSSQLEIALTRAIRRAGAPMEGFGVSVESAEVVVGVELEAAIEKLPEHGLVAATEDMDGRRGLMALEHTLVDALIEVQTTGRVEETQGPPRSVTRIDEALCTDFIDLLFSALAHEGNGITGRNWPERIRYGSLVRDRGQINLLLPAKGYHLLQATITAATLKTGKLLILLPTDPALARRNSKKSEPRKPRPQSWKEDVLAALGPAILNLDAILMRVYMPLSKVEALGDGDLIPFDPADLSAMTLEGDDGHVIARGKLGQIGGRRAVRLGGGEAPATASTAGLAGAAFDATPNAPPPMPQAEFEPNVAQTPDLPDLPDLSGDMSPDAFAPDLPPLADAPMDGMGMALSDMMGPGDGPAPTAD